MPTPTQQTDLDALVTDSVDLLCEVRALQECFPDATMFGGTHRFDDAIMRSEALTQALLAAKLNYQP
jgi:hypothetical protein